MNSKGFISVDKIIDQLDIRQNMVIADFGSGHGFFSVAFAKKVGPSGQIYAIDVMPQTLEAVRSRAKLEGLFNIRLVRGNLEKSGGSTLPSGSCDLVFIANILFQVPDKNTLLTEAGRVLKSGGQLAVVEWQAATAIATQQKLQISPAELKNLVLSKGFAEVKSIDAGSHHYGFIFKK